VCSEKFEAHPARTSFYFDTRAQIAADNVYEAKNEDSFCSISTFKDPFEAVSGRKSGDLPPGGRKV
jgi:hypothetical protein